MDIVKAGLITAAVVAIVFLFLSFPFWTIAGFILVIAVLGYRWVVLNLLRDKWH